MKRCALKPVHLLRVAALALLGGAMMAQAADYPERPIRYVVAFAPGAFNDILARIVAERLSARLGKQVIVDNRAGAGGNVGAELVARSAPDGYTLLNVSSAHTIAQSLYPKLNYNLERDFAPVVGFAGSPLIMTIHPGLPATTVPEFVTWSKANRMVYASGGIGVISHLSVEIFKLAAGIDGTHVPYKGGGPGVLDVIGGRVHMMTNTLPTLAGSVNGGRLRALGIMAEKRHTLLPNVPTFAEAGFSDFVMGNWLGIMAPRGTPAPIVKRLADEVTAIVSSADVRERFLKEGADPVVGTTAQFATFVRSELARYGKAVKASGATAN